MQPSNDNRREIRVYAKRWWILVLMCCLTTICLMIMKSFLIARKIYMSYFGAEDFEWDWVSLGGLAGAAALIPVFAWLSYANVVKFRILALAGMTSQVLFCIIIVVTILFPQIYRMMISLSVIEGVAYSVSISAVPLFAVLWFPENQVATAIAFNVACVSAGSLLGDIVPSQILQTVPDNITFKNDSTVMTWKLETKNTLLYLYSPLGIIAVLLVVFVFFVVSDLPPHPPSPSQLIMRNLLNNEAEKSALGFLHESKRLLSDVTYVFCTVVIGIMYSTSTETFTLTEIIRKDMEVVPTNMKPNVISSYIISANLLASFLSSFASAALLRRFNQMKKQAILGSFFTLLFSVGILLSYIFKNITGLLVFNIAYGFSTRICGVPLLKLIFQHTFPTNEAFVSIWTSGINAITLLVIGELSRVFMNAWGSLSIFIYLIAMWVVAFIFTIIIKPRNDAQLNIDDAPTERSPLISDSRRNS